MSKWIRNPHFPYEVNCNSSFSSSSLTDVNMGNLLDWSTKPMHGASPDPIMAKVSIKTDTIISQVFCIPSLFPVWYLFSLVTRYCTFSCKLLCIESSLTCVNWAWYIVDVSSSYCRSTNNHACTEKSEMKMGLTKHTESGHWRSFKPVLPK